MKEKSTVFIKIAGTCGTGKTTIACKLARVLKAQGISTDLWEFDDSHQDDITDEAIDRNLKALSPKIHVVIQTEQLKRIVHV
jgi:uridine kinase